MSDMEGQRAKIEGHYRTISPKLVNWLAATGSSYAEACDLVQEVFLRIWKMRDDLVDNDASVSGLAFTIARNLRKNLVRDNKRLSFVEEIREEDAGAADPAALPSETKERRDELRGKLTAAFAKLPPQLREAYTLFQIGRQSIREIAAGAGISENLVKVRIFRAKEKLRAILAESGVTLDA
ncbi:MAG: RNA polymerase sigma factor [Kiritimatiellae bacterium]|nr:RNA polymerase sigma factor [Kiritimatiellia bacterium]